MITQKKALVELNPNMIFKNYTITKWRNMTLNGVQLQIKQIASYNNSNETTSLGTKQPREAWLKARRTTSPRTEQPR